jgi:hypothetical protein
LFFIGLALWRARAGVSRPSLVSDEEVLDIKDKREKNIKASASASVISLFIGLVIAAVVAIFVLRFTRASSPHTHIHTHTHARARARLLRSLLQHA